YVNAGGVVWVQAAVQGVQGDNFPMPFGGQGNAADFSSSDNIVDPASPMMTGVPNPIVGNFASHVSESGLPGAAHIVVINPNDQQPVLYDLRPGGGCGPSPTPTATATPTGSPTCTPGGGKIYNIAGFRLGVQTNTTRSYDIATNTWTTAPVVPTPVTGPGSAVYQGKLCLFGGGFPSPVTSTQVGGPVANRWSSGAAMNFARLWFYGGAIDDTSIVAPGGDNPPGIQLNVNEQLTGSWAIKAPLPFNSRGPFAVSDGTFVYIGGGYDGST